MVIVQVKMRGQKREKSGAAILWRDVPRQGRAPRFPIASTLTQPASPGFRI